jgi:L-lactate dehydrogenase (cytochrome)
MLKLVLAQKLGVVDPTPSRAAIVAAEQATRDKFYAVSSVVPKTISDDEPIPISLCMNVDDMERAAKRVISKRAWSYFHSAADSLQSYNTNRGDWTKISFRPRVLKNVSRVNMKCSIMGQQSNLPFFISPAAMARLGHKDGELCNAIGAGVMNIPYCTSTFSSVSHDELAAAIAARKGGCLFFQLYVSKAKSQTLELIAMARRLDFKALVITVDTPVLGKREEDELYKAEVDHAAGEPVKSILETVSSDIPSTSTEEPILRGVTSSALDWDDLVWIREAWGNHGPVVLKGIQTAEDAKKAAGLGLGIYLSNHGGRQIDCGPSSIRTLLEIRKFCPEILGTVEIFLDGGVRRGTDVLKAICLGATAVAMGRPFMYALGAYGTEGVLKTIQCKLSYSTLIGASLIFLKCLATKSRRQ